jgi:hypothetical protein
MQLLIWDTDDRLRLAVAGVLGAAHRPPAAEGEKDKPPSFGDRSTQLVVRGAALSCHGGNSLRRGARRETMAPTRPESWDYRFMSFKDRGCMSRITSAVRSLTPRLRLRLDAFGVLRIRT